MTGDLCGEVIGLVTQVTDAPPGVVSDHSRFDQLGNWDSLAAVRLLNAIEAHLGLRLDLRDYFSVTDVAQLVSLVSAHIREVR